MKIIEVNSLALEDIKVITFERFHDNRGYFTEPFRLSDFKNHQLMKDIFSKYEFYQQNESYSQQSVMRGLHFQWNPYMGKLVRTVMGRMVDMVLDIRKNSPTFGKAIMHDMPAKPGDIYSQWIWLPPGFAHGNFFTEQTLIEYFCSGEYSPGCEAGISPLSADIDWSICKYELKSLFDDNVRKGAILSEKDKKGVSLTEWNADNRSDNFIYGEF